MVGIAGRGGIRGGGGGGERGGRGGGGRGGGGRGGGGGGGGKDRGGGSGGPDAPVFMSNRGRRLSRGRAKQVFPDGEERAGLDQRQTFHQLRHSAVNGVYRETKDILLIQRFARHSSLLVTSAYLHPTDEDLARSVQKIRC